MVVNSRMIDQTGQRYFNSFNSFNGDKHIEALKEDYIAFKKLSQKYDPLLKSLLKMYSCEKCGECCRTEKVSSGKRDLHRLMCYDIRMFQDAVDEIRGDDLFRLKLPCHYLDTNNQCKCYDIKPQPCDLYPFIFLYGYFISISYCPYGTKIIDDLMEYCRIKGIGIQTVEESDNVTMKNVISRMDKFYSDSKLINTEPESDRKILNVPYDILEDFYIWIKLKRKQKRKQKR